MRTPTLSRTGRPPPSGPPGAVASLDLCRGGCGVLAWSWPAFWSCGLISTKRSGTGSDQAVAEPAEVLAAVDEVRAFVERERGLDSHRRSRSECWPAATSTGSPPASPTPGRARPGQRREDPGVTAGVRPAARRNQTCSANCARWVTAPAGSRSTTSTGRTSRYGPSPPRRTTGSSSPGNSPTRCSTSGSGWTVHASPRPGTAPDSPSPPWWRATWPASPPHTVRRCPSWIRRRSPTRKTASPGASPSAGSRRWCPGSPPYRTRRDPHWSRPSSPTAGSARWTGPSPILPTTAAQVLFPDRYLDRRAAVTVPAPVADGQVFDEGLFGADHLLYLLGDVPHRIRRHPGLGWRPLRRLARR